MDIIADDKTIVQMLIKPDLRETGFKMLTHKYGQRLYWHIRRIVVSHNDAEDVLQNTFIKIFSNISTFRGDCELLSWIYKIATNEALHLLRSHTRFFQSIDTLNYSLSEQLITETDLPPNAPEVLLQQALLKLPTQQRIAFNMRYFDNLPYEQIAEITGKNIGTLKTNYHYAVEKIATYITENSAL